MPWNSLELSRWTLSAPAAWLHHLISYCQHFLLCYLFFLIATLFTRISTRTLTKSVKFPSAHEHAQMKSQMRFQVCETLLSVGGPFIFQGCSLFMLQRAHGRTASCILATRFFSRVACPQLPSSLRITFWLRFPLGLAYIHGISARLIIMVNILPTLFALLSFLFNCDIVHTNLHPNFNEIR